MFQARDKLLVNLPQDVFMVDNIKNENIFQRASEKNHPNNTLLFSRAQSHGKICMVAQNYTNLIDNFTKMSPHVLYSGS